MTIAPLVRHDAQSDDDASAAPVVQAAIRLYRSRAFHEVTLAAVAAEAGVSVPDLLSRVMSWEALVIAVVDLWNAERMASLLSVAQEHGAIAHLRAIMAANVADPALMRILSALVNVVATPGHPMAAALQQRWVHFHAHVQRALMHDVVIGREPRTMEPARGAEQLIALYEGLQLRALVRQHMNLLDAWDRAVGRLREGWSHAYRQPLWEV